MKGDFVTVEIAKRLKEKGYTGETTGKLVEKIPGTEREEWDDAEMMYVTVTDVVTYPRAHVYDVLKWLREEKGIHVTTGYNNISMWYYLIIHLKENFVKKSNTWKRGFNNYEEAAIAGIEYAIDNLI